MILTILKVYTGTIIIPLSFVKVKVEFKGMETVLS